MTMTSEQRVAYEIAWKQDGLERAIKNGGLPTEAETDSVDKALQRAFDQTEDLVSRVGGIANSAGLDVPIPITLEHVGLLSIFAYELETRGQDFIEFGEQIRKELTLLDSIRVDEQRSQGRDDG